MVLGIWVIVKGGAVVGAGGTAVRLEMSISNVLVVKSGDGVVVGSGLVFVSVNTVVVAESREEGGGMISVLVRVNLEMEDSEVVEVYSFWLAVEVSELT